MIWLDKEKEGKLNEVSNDSSHCSLHDSGLRDADGTEDFRDKLNAIILACFHC